MANNLRVFNTNSEYQSADLVHPAVSYVIETDKVHYEPTTPSFQGKWKATYQDSHTESAECSGDYDMINYGEINLQDLVSVEVGQCVAVIYLAAFDNCSSHIEKCPRSDIICAISCVIENISLFTSHV